MKMLLINYLILDLLFDDYTLNKDLEILVTFSENISVKHEYH